MRDIWQRQGFAQALLALLTACVLSSHNTGPIGASTSPALGYVYWIARIGLQAMAICAASALLYYAIPRLNSRPVILAVFAALVSHPFFVTMVTMMDLFIGFPEFDPVEWERSLSSRFALLRQETLYLLDNQILLSLVLHLPRIWTHMHQSTSDRTSLSRDTSSADQTHVKFPVQLNGHASAQEQNEQTQVPLDPPAFLTSVTPPVTSPVLMIEAQEHYIRAYSYSGQGMALYTFKNALKDVEHHPGLQVHRSWWVADEAIIGLTKRTNGYSLNTKIDVVIPVSRRFEKAVIERFGTMEATLGNGSERGSTENTPADRDEA